MKRLILFFNTLRYLKWQQIYFRLIRKLIKLKVAKTIERPQPKRSKSWQHHPLFDCKINTESEACFLNHAKKLDLPSDWNNKSLSKLWVYNLHYFEDLLCNNAEKKRNLHLQLLNCWVEQNPIGHGDGWEPYPTSLRIVNIIKAWLGGLNLNKKIYSSVFTQANFLSYNLEKHLLGNHYFVNLKALLFAGVIFENKNWYRIAEKGLISEIPEQILEDGANFELSPMYHSLILLDMLDMLNLSRAYPTYVSNKLVSLLEDYIPRMLAFMEAMAHPDGGVSFFNDSSNGIAPTKSKIESYAKKLGFKINPLDSRKIQVIDNAKSGYICATTNGNKLIFDAAPVGADYIPGHAHADTLSFELSIGTQRVFVNSGTSEYGLSEKRLNQRKTASHNTVEVDGKDSSQVWSSFRVANRAKIIFRNVELKNEENIEMQAAHNGYNSLFGACIHSRKLIFSKSSLVVSDSLQRPFKFAKSHFYFHPDLIVNLENNFLKVEGEGFILQSNLLEKQASLHDSFWYPEFGLEIPNKMLEISFQTSDLDVDFSWTKS